MTSRPDRPPRRRGQQVSETPHTVDSTPDGRRRETWTTTWDDGSTSTSVMEDIPDEFWKEINRMGGVSGADHRYEVFIDGPRELDVAFGYGDGELIHPVSRAFLIYRFATHLVNLPKLGIAGLHGLARMIEPARRLGVYAPEGRQMLDALAAGLGDAN